MCCARLNFVELDHAPLSISTAASQTNTFFLSFFFFFYTRQKFSSALATLKFSQISLSFLLVKEGIYIIKGP